jgi:S-adenosylmethionine:tRNA ribosyltransferase-isomerase
MENDLKILEDYNYDFPKELIAQKPVSPRDAARLLVYNREDESVHYDTFRNLTKYLPKNAVLVFNQTKVIPARFEVKKETGGTATLLYLTKVEDGWKVLSDRKLIVGSRVKISNYEFLISKQENQFYFLKGKNLEKLLEKYGKAPTPPYIKRQGTRSEYQTIFAKKLGAVAAPTASLHFTKRLLGKLKARSYQLEFITLHVGMGTFAPLTEKQFTTGKLHEERYEITKATWARIVKAKKQGRPIIAVGTTALRALESGPGKKSTQLFIRPGYKFGIVDGLITNFHVPRSSLMMLVSALVGLPAQAGRKKLLDLYREAIDQKYRLFSFGDGMLVL